MKNKEIKEETYFLGNDQATQATRDPSVERQRMSLLYLYW